MKDFGEDTYLYFKEDNKKIEIIANIPDEKLDENKVNLSVKLISKLIRRSRNGKKKIRVTTNLDLNADEKEDNNKWSLIASLNACNIENKNERMEYIYMAACKYLDNEFRNKNICEFKDDVCFYKRPYNCTNGCCHEISIFMPWKGAPVCRYLKNGTCTADCLGCKLFVCDGIRKKGINYTCFNVPLIRWFFNLAQKIMIKATVFAPKEKVLRRLRFFS